MASPLLRLVTAGSGGKGPRLPGTMTWLRGASLHGCGGNAANGSAAPAENRHGGAPRGARPRVMGPQALSQKRLGVPRPYRHVAGARHAPERLSALRHPSIGVGREDQDPGANASRQRKRLCRWHELERQAGGRARQAGALFLARPFWPNKANRSVRSMEPSACSPARRAGSRVPSGDTPPPAVPRRWDSINPSAAKL